MCVTCPRSCDFSPVHWHVVMLSEGQQLVQACVEVLVQHVVGCRGLSDGTEGLTNFCCLPIEPCLAPSLEQQEQELTIALGQPVRLCCGLGERGGHWYKEGSRLAPAGRVRSWRGRLEIAAFLPEDAGHYLCLARSSMIVLHNLTLVADGKRGWLRVKGCQGETTPSWNSLCP